MRILIAEDDPICSKILASTIRGFGHDVTAAEDGEQAWAIYDRDPVRVIVSDWVMPGMDGLALCRRLRERPMTEYTYFIVMTSADTSSEAYSNAMAAGVDDFLAKPLDRDMLYARLHVAGRILRFATQVAQLKDLLPICSFCHKISDDMDHWETLETYLSQRIGTRFSHSVCPDCMKEQSEKLDGEAELGGGTMLEDDPT